MALSLEERIAALEAKVDMILREIEDMKMEMRKRNGVQKIMLLLYITTLSFLAAVLGIHWSPGVKAP